MYEYKAYVTKVYDGDTITVNIDLGFNIWMLNQKIRLAGIDAPEITGETRKEGLLSRNALRDRILKKEILLVTEQDKAEKYGRWLGVVYTFPGELNVNKWLVSTRYAKNISW